MRRLLLLSSLAIGSQLAYSKSLTEKDIWLKAKAPSSPTMQKIEALKLSGQLGYDSTDAEYGSVIFANGNYAESNEKALINFSPVFTPTSQVSVGVSKKFSYGFCHLTSSRGGAVYTTTVK